MKTNILSAKQPHAIKLAAHALLQGELVAFPTDTVYGLGVLVDDSHAIQQLYIVKSRPASKAIPVLIGKPADLEMVTSQLGKYARKFADEFWPGPLTLVVTRNPSLPVALSTAETIGVRMPDHPAALRLLNTVGPLAVTSANLSGKSNALSAGEVLQQLDGKIPIILDGGTCPGGTPSTVVDCTGAEPHILRQGPISLEQLISVMN